MAIRGLLIFSLRQTMYKSQADKYTCRNIQYLRNHFVWGSLNPPHEGPIEISIERADLLASFLGVPTFSDELFGTHILKETHFGSIQNELVRSTLPPIILVQWKMGVSPVVSSSLSKSLPLSKLNHDYVSERDTQNSILSIKISTIRMCFATCIISPVQNTLKIRPFCWPLPKKFTQKTGPQKKSPYEKWSIQSMPPSIKNPSGIRDSTVCPMFGGAQSEIWFLPIWWLGGGNSKILYFHPYLGKIPILTSIFEMGWNHQLDDRSEIQVERWFFPPWDV